MNIFEYMEKYFKSKNNLNKSFTQFTAEPTTTSRVELLYFNCLK